MPIKLKMMTDIFQKLVLFSFLFLLACTNPFSTRNPDLPDPGGQPIGGGNLQSSPDSLLSKIRRTFLSKDNKAYRQCFHDANFLNADYRFIPETDEAPRLLSWTLIDEENYFSNLAADEIEKIDFQPLDQTVSPLNSTSPSPDTMIIDFDYQIKVNFISAAAVPEVYRGQGLMKVLRPEDSFSLWYIYEWEDFRSDSTGTDGTWSSMKVKYR